MVSVVGVESVDMCIVGLQSGCGCVDMCTRWKSVGELGVDRLLLCPHLLLLFPISQRWSKYIFGPLLWDSHWCSRLLLDTVAVQFGKTFTELFLPTMDIGQYPLLPSISDDFCLLSPEKATA